MISALYDHGTLINITIISSLLALFIFDFMIKKSPLDKSLIEFIRPKNRKIESVFLVIMYCYLTFTHFGDWILIYTIEKMMNARYTILDGIVIKTGLFFMCFSSLALLNLHKGWRRFGLVPWKYYNFILVGVIGLFTYLNTFFNEFEFPFYFIPTLLFVLLTSRWRDYIPKMRIASVTVVIVAISSVHFLTMTADDYCDALFGDIFGKRAYCMRGSFLFDADDWLRKYHKEYGPSAPLNK